MSPLSNFLSQTMIFQDLPLDQLADLEGLAVTKSYGKGEVLFHQGDAAIGFFVIQLGRVKVFKLSPQGKEQILHIFGQGEHFAEVPALDGKCFPASAAALESSELLFFPRQPFLTLLEQRPSLAINLLKSFARHLRRFSNLVDSLALQDVPARLATYLLNLSGELNNVDIIKLDLPKNQLAARLGTIPETLSRAFSKLNRAGLISMDGIEITLLDLENLKHLANCDR
ncbi:cAMP-binding protein [Leptolyngbya sp. PCC 7375]|nr:cAMP-binding protein [Leptolyngbya sp. PCC 7375]